MTRQAVTSPRPVAGVINFAWSDVAILLLPRLQTIFNELSTNKRESIDEFIVRREIRNIISNCLSSAFVTYKEVNYEESKKTKRRLDIALISAVDPHQHQLISIELKSDAGDVAGVKADWKKLLKSTAKRRISIFSGVASRTEVDNFIKNFTPLPADVKLTVSQAINFTTLLAAPGGGKLELCSFVFVWSIATEKPNLTFYVYEQED